ncbi:MAG: peptidylprolyl isomerase [Chitinophagaceae bacterium]
MKKPILALLLFSLAILPASAQTLFTYGKHKVDASEFLRAFDKNNRPEAGQRKQAMKDYLQLFINSRLKIQDAYDHGYDTLPQLRSEMDVLRGQIIEPYLSDPAAIDRLRHEAFLRSQKDIHVAHIFISFTNAAGVVDTVAAQKKLSTVKSQLNAGADFKKLAREYSDDPSAKLNGGDLSYITVFTLPYAFENIIYQLSPGKVSAPFRSGSGYHIFKNLGERKALGRIRIDQILLALPPAADQQSIDLRQKLADSLYQVLIAGGDFASLAQRYSNDLVSAQANGRVPDISVGQYDADFENHIASIRNGQIGLPFRSQHGFHIVRKVEDMPVPTDSNDVSYRELLEQKVINDDRWKTARDFIYKQVLKRPGIKPAPYSNDVIWAISDSLLDFKPAGAARKLSRETILFHIGRDSSTVNDWIRFAQMNRYRSDRGGIRPYPELMQEFRQQAMYQYYRNHLEDYNEKFRIQMTEFREGNLFFEVMQQEVWNKAQTDTASLRKIFESNKQKYQWGNSATAWLFFCPDSSTAATLLTALKTNISNINLTMDAFRDRVVADSARFDWDQLPGLNGSEPIAGRFTSFVSNPTDQTTSFAYIIKVFTQPEPRTFEEARGLVMNDYQQMLEEQWLKKLKKKYPVQIDQKVLSAL